MRGHSTHDEIPERPGVAVSSPGVATLAKVLRYPFERPTVVDPPQPAEDAGARLLKRLRAASQEIERSSSLLAGLRERPLEEWPFLFDNRPSLRSLALAREIILAGHQHGFEDPLEGAAMIQLGIALAGRLDADLYGQRLVDDVEGRGWALTGDCYRLAGDFRAAEAAFRRAKRLLAETPDPDEVATYCYLLGILRKDQRRFAPARRLYEQARRLSEEIGDRERVARILTSLGLLHLDRGEPEEALPALLDALATIDEATDPRVALAARTNCTICLVELGDHQGARELFEVCRPEYVAARDVYLRLRARWLEGRIASGLGETEKAERILSEVHEAYVECGQHYNAALVSLHLAALYARRGGSAELRELAEEMARVFLEQEIPAEAIAALTFFRQAVEQERVTEELVGGVARFLQRARTDPELRFARC